MARCQTGLPGSDLRLAAKCAEKQTNFLIAACAVKMSNKKVLSFLHISHFADPSSDPVQASWQISLTPLTCNTHGSITAHAAHAPVPAIVLV